MLRPEGASPVLPLFILMQLVTSYLFLKRTFKGDVLICIVSLADSFSCCLLSFREELGLLQVWVNSVLLSN